MPKSAAMAEQHPQQTKTIPSSKQDLPIQDSSMQDCLARILSNSRSEKLLRDGGLLTAREYEELKRCYGDDKAGEIDRWLRQRCQSDESTIDPNQDRESKLAGNQHCSVHTGKKGAESDSKKHGGKKGAESDSKKHGGKKGKKGAESDSKKHGGKKGSGITTKKKERLSKKRSREESDADYDDASVESNASDGSHVTVGDEKLYFPSRIHAVNFDEESWKLRVEVSWRNHEKDGTTKEPIENVRTYGGNHGETLLFR